MAEQVSQGTKVTMPHLAESLVSGTIGKWLKKPGDYIQEYDVICELITDKVNTEMPSPIEGTLIEIVAQEGETIDVGETMCYIAESGEAEIEDAQAQVPSEEQPQTESSPQKSSDSVKSEQTVSIQRQSVTSGDGASRKRYSPAVLRLAGEHGIDLQHVPGSGRGGRITRKDILKWIEEGPQPVQQAAPEQQAKPNVPEQPAAPARTVAPPAQATVSSQGDTHLDITPVRRIIAERMKQSVTEIPHAWTMMEVDMTRLVQLREQWKAEFFKKEGVKLTYLPFILKAVVHALKDYPMLNSTWAEDQIIIKKDINLSLAVGTEESVSTPVIRRADQKNIAGLAIEIDSVVAKAKAGQLTLSDMQGDTFTVNNTGAFGSILSYPIINYPQAAILSLESIVKKPVVIDDMIAIRSMANMCLSLDHRVLDGMVCGRFLQKVKQNIENYNADTQIY